MVRVLWIPLVVVCGLLLIGIVLPSKRDTSVAGWWARVLSEIHFFARVGLALACFGVMVWWVVLPLVGWR